MNELNYKLPTCAYLEEIKHFFPNDSRPEIYNTIFREVSRFDPVLVVHPTFTKKLYDEVVAEQTLERLFNQLERAVVGMRKKSMLPRLVVLERHADNSIHAHAIIGKAKGESKKLFETDFAHQVALTFGEIKARLTFQCGKGIGRIGHTKINAVYYVQGAVDYLFKEITSDDLNISEKASKIDYSSPTSKKCSKYPTHSMGG